MRLEELLRSKGGRQQAGAKRPRQEGGSKPAPAGPSLPPPANGHSAWRPALTRTALRKQHKARRLAAQQAAQREAQERQRQQQEQQEGGLSSGDDEAAGAGAPPRVRALTAPAAAAAAGPGEGGRGAGAYGALLGTLQGASAAFADLYQQRRREQAGHDSEEESSEEEGEEEGEEGVEGGGEEEGSLEEDGSELGELEGDGEGEEEEEGQRSRRGQRREEEGGEAEAEGGWEDAAAANGVAGADNGGGGGTGERRRRGKGEEEEEEEGGEEEEEESFVLVGRADGAAAAGGGGGEEEAGRAGGAGPAPEEHFADQFDRVLTDNEVSALSAREGAGAPKYKGCAASAPWLAQWKAAAVEAAPGTRLPQQAPADLASYGVKERLQARWREEQQQQQRRQQQQGGTTGGDFATPQQRALFAMLNAYCDVLHPCCPYPTDPEAPDPELDATLLHVLNHCAKAADRVRKNNERLKAAAAAVAGRGGAKGGGGEAAEGEEPPRDQGFVRPKVLLLLPYRNLAYRAVLRLLRLAVKETRKDSIQNKDRFLEEYGPGDEELSEREQRALARKPADFRALFDGNMDDHFRLGIKLTRGAVRLYTDFFQSDIIVASPLALATKLGEGPGEGGEDPQDFLSSIEIAVLQRADVMLMQNWSHVLTALFEAPNRMLRCAYAVFEALNRMPHQQHGVDIMRVREWALSGWSRMYRQTVLLSSFASPEMNALLGRGCVNHAGSVRLRPACPGVLAQVLPQVRQVFERLPAAGSLAAEADARFEHFRKVAWPRMREAGRGGGQLIYVPSYFDFVRVRNFLKAEGASFLVLSEYTEKADAARARSYFFDGRKQILLYTERAQFYNRNRIRGIKDVLFYQLPEHAQFYPEMLNLLEEGGAGSSAGSEHATVAVLFGRADALRLERVVGSARSGKMLKGSTNAFLFC